MSDFQKRFVICTGLLAVAVVFLCAMTEFDNMNLMVGMAILGLFLVAVLLYEPLAPYCRKLRDALKQPEKDSEPSEGEGVSKAGNNENCGADVDQDAKIT